jgi:hypothetical protein
MRKAGVPAGLESVSRRIPRPNPNKTHWVFYEGARVAPEGSDVGEAAHLDIKTTQQ